MIKPQSILVSCLLLAGTVLQSQVILPVESRTGVMDGMQKTLANVDREAMDFKVVPSPFNPPEDAPEAEADQPQSTAPRIVISSARMSDRDALRIIASQFKPIGSLVVGERGVLQLASGNTMEEGASFAAKIKGHNYPVVISEVTSKGYTLSLGEADIQRNFIEAGASD
jgi:hypothetical protein